MGNQTFGIPLRLASDLVKGLGLVEAVETGTYLGDTTRVLRALVPKVWTIELSQQLSDTARERLSDLEGIEFIIGDSKTSLAGVVSVLSGPALFWLDAHYMAGGVGAGENAQCPILDELAAIDVSRTAGDDTILIDDADLFLGGPPADYNREDFPTFLEVVDALRHRTERYITVMDDVIVAVPRTGQAVVEGYWRLERERRTEREQNSPLGRAKRGARRVVPSKVYEGLRDILK